MDTFSLQKITMVYLKYCIVNLFICPDRPDTYTRVIHYELLSFVGGLVQIFLELSEQQTGSVGSSFYFKTVQPSPYWRETILSWYTCSRGASHQHLRG